MAVWVCVLVGVVALVAGVVLGHSSAFGAHEPEVVVGEATLANKDNWLTIFTAEDRDLLLEFDGSGVAWLDDEDVAFDGFGDKKPPCLRVNRPARMEVSYVPLPNGDGVVTQVRCLTGS